jgi:hypothetical protein
VVAAKKITMRILFFFIILIFVSCQNSSETKSSKEPASVDDKAPEPSDLTNLSYSIVRNENCTLPYGQLEFNVYENLTGQSLFGVSDPYVVQLFSPLENDSLKLYFGIEYDDDVKWIDQEGCDCFLEAYFSSAGYTRFYTFSRDSNSFFTTKLLKEGEILICEEVDLNVMAYSTRLDGEETQHLFSKVNGL